jgi:hypothetical protein
VSNHSILDQLRALTAIDGALKPHFGVGHMTIARSAAQG